MKYCGFIEKIVVIFSVGSLEGMLLMLGMLSLKIMVVIVLMSSVMRIDGIFVVILGKF